MHIHALCRQNVESIMLKKMVHTVASVLECVTYAPCHKGVCRSSSIAPCILSLGGGGQTHDSTHLLPGNKALVTTRMKICYPNFAFILNRNMHLVTYVVNVNNYCWISFDVYVCWVSLVKHCVRLYWIINYIEISVYFWGDYSSLITDVFS